MSYKSKIYLVEKAKGELMPLEETGYVQESDLQELLANYPDLIPGDQINPDDPRRWLLVSREMAVPDGNFETGRWSLDHLFLDQDGIPTFVECKRSSDTRNRREVVAQMLDYAANGVEYWDIANLRQTAAEEAKSRGNPLNEQILELLGNDADADSVEEYWNSVEENLRDHKVRLIFVADAIPKELRRMVEFLNEEMSKIAVLAVEIKSYQGEGSEQAIVPRVIGLTEASRVSKQKKTSKIPKLTYDEFFDRCSSKAKEFFEYVIDVSEKRGFPIRWGRTGFAVRANLGENGELISFLYGKHPSELQFYFDKWSIIARGPDAPLRQELTDLDIFS